MWMHLCVCVCMLKYECLQSEYVCVYPCACTCVLMLYHVCALVYMDRIDATREMCTLLKNHVARTEDVLAVGERDKETFQRVDKQRVDEYQV